MNNIRPSCLHVCVCVFNTSISVLIKCRIGLYDKIQLRNFYECRHLLGYSAV
jgi:hypothetical protein